MALNQSTASGVSTSTQTPISLPVGGGRSFTTLFEKALNPKTPAHLGSNSKMSTAFRMIGFMPWRPLDNFADTMGMTSAGELELDMYVLQSILNAWPSQDPQQPPRTSATPTTSR